MSQNEAVGMVNVIIPQDAHEELVRALDHEEYQGKAVRVNIAGFG